MRHTPPWLRQDHHLRPATPHGHGHPGFLRPDGHTAWLRTAGHGHADRLHEALQHWYGPAAPSNAGSAAIFRS
ncbi:hypothetical protein ABZ743_24050 [Streptomyces sp. NPDC006662]|uniref:aromatic-ring hydroxylase C-terminal domain-containing protein n=1 Tax=Streptomyces sp. NPDC006662 TaxID=3156902 RepID=UPI0033E8327B